MRSMSMGREVRRGGGGSVRAIEGSCMFSYSEPSNIGVNMATKEVRVTKAIASSRNILGLGKRQTPRRYAKIAGA